jgi:15-cis-phytoene synthase
MPISSPTRRFASPADCAASRLAIRQGSRSFHLASLLLPVRVREPAFAVYAFCRHADDVIDRDGGGQVAIAALRAMLDRVYSGAPRASHVERSFADAVAEFAIPRELPEALLEGLAWDAEGRRYGTLSELRAYAARVAGTVGAMMTLIMGVRDGAVIARACDLGVAMQLTNICRDIGEDARAGRLYLPVGMLAAQGIDPNGFVASPVHDARLRRVICALLDEAERLYDRALAGIEALPPDSRRGIAAARMFYREIGREIMRGIDPVTARAHVSSGRKLSLLVRPRRPERAADGALHVPALGETRFIVAHVERCAARSEPVPFPRWWDFPARAIRLVELLARFAARGNRIGARGSPGFDDGVALARRQTG